MDYKIQFLLFIFLCCNVAVASEKPFVQLLDYSAVGFQNITAKGNAANVFLGLPYAKPPVKELRFEKPEPISPAPSKTIEATKWPLPCHQVADITEGEFTTSEDCLYLNIFTPAKPSKKLLPVLIFIHGGGYGYGYTQAYGYEYFVDNFVSQDIIMVTLQYRLAHFGFLATEDGVINGNFGHFDQLEALKFIKRNIQSFGGDPNRITLSGHSAGSLSVHTLSLTPKTKDLYQYEIHIAASNYCSFAINTAFVFNHSELISNAVGCNQSNTNKKKLCLKKVNYTRFWEVRKELRLSDFPSDTKDILYWTTVYENDLFEGKEIDELQKAAEKRNTLYGIDAGEGLLWTLNTGNPITTVFSQLRGFKPEDRKNADNATIKNYLKTILYSISEEKQEEAIERIYDFYQIADQYVAENPLHYFEKYTEIFTDVVIKVPTTKEINAKLQHDWPNQYMFQFSYVRPHDRPIIGDLPGHGYFLLYFCGLEIYTTTGLTATNEETQLQKNFSDMLAAFVKTGNPSFSNVSVPKITSQHFPYIDFDKDVSIRDTDFKAKNDFWKSLDEYFGYDLIRDEPIIKKRDKNEL